MNRFSKMVFSGARTHALAVDTAILLARLWVGLAMALVYGTQKLPPQVGFIEVVGKLGFPAPTFFAWCAALSEVVGGAMIALGVMTRPAAAMLGFTMFVAAFLQKSGLEFFSPDRLNPTHYLIFCLAILLTGGGRISLDHLLRPRTDARLIR